MSTDISCPFCNKPIIIAYDIEDAYNHETEEYDEIPEDYNEGKCPHLSFVSDWAYAGSQIENSWLKEMSIFSFILNSYEDEEISIELIEKIKSEAIEEVLNYEKLSSRDQSKIERRIAEYLIDDEEFCQELLAKSFPDYKTHIEVAFVDKGDGIQGCGGPTYMCIFLEKI
jgi:hypothetical protein